ncbi:MAG: PaaI family thioesterase [Solirubrobacteraceae bacterium]
MTDTTDTTDTPAAPPTPDVDATGGPAAAESRRRTAMEAAAAHLRTGGPGIDGVSAFFGMRWLDPETVHLTVTPELINAAGLLSGVVAYALVDYCMGSALWVHTAEHEAIATLNIAINYIQTATEGEVTCHSSVDRRNRTSATLRSEVRAEDGRLLATAIGSFAIYVRRDARGES